MKKSIKLLLIISACMIANFLSAGICHAEEVPQDIHYTLSDDGTLTISGSGVVADKQEMEKYKENTKRLVIEEGITDIVDVGLRDFPKLEVVKLPQTIKAVRKKVFERCYKLKEADIGGAVVIESYAFSECPLKELNIRGVTSIGRDAFANCSLLKNITNAESVGEIGKDAFWGCSLLRWPSFGNRLMKIGRRSFQGCDSFKCVVIPDSVTEISSRAFWDCDKMEKLVIPASIKSWKKHVTEGCLRLKTVVNRSQVSCELEDRDGYMIWRVNGKRVKRVPAKKTAVATGKKIKLTYKLRGGKQTGKLPQYYQYGTILHIPQNVKKKGCMMLGWLYSDLAVEETGDDSDKQYRSPEGWYLGPVARTPVVIANWFEYSIKNTKKGTVELRIKSGKDKVYEIYAVRCSENKNMKNPQIDYIFGNPAKGMYQNLKKGKTYYFQFAPMEDVDDDICTPEEDDWVGKRKIKITK